MTIKLFFQCGGIRGRSEEENYETDPWTSGKTYGESRRAAVLAVYCLSRAPSNTVPHDWRWHWGPRER